MSPRLIRFGPTAGLPPSALLRHSPAQFFCLLFLRLEFAWSLVISVLMQTAFRAFRSRPALFRQQFPAKPSFASPTEPSSHCPAQLFALFALHSSLSFSL
ncbi:hypothetical protein ACMYSQ_008106 [Aspergillus niger]